MIPATRLLLLAVALFAASCNDGKKSTADTGSERQYGQGCRHDGDCNSNEVCLLGSCSPLPADSGGQPTVAAELSAAPQSLGFGTVEVGDARSLAVVLSNTGEVVVTLDALAIEPATAPFTLEPTGAGPFWVRPGRSREVFVRYAPTDSAPDEAVLTIASEAPLLRVPLSGN